MSKNKYYLCNATASKLDKHEYDKLILTEEDIIDNNLMFVNQILDDLESDEIQINRIDDNTLVYSSLIELLSAFKYEFEFEFDDSEIIPSLYRDFIIFRYNKKSNTFKKVKNSEIAKNIKLLEEPESKTEYDINLIISELKNKVPDFDIFLSDIHKTLTYFETLFETDINYITLASSDTSYDILVTKFQSDEYNRVKSDIFNNDETTSAGGFMYECGYENIYNYILFQLINGNPIGCTIRTTITKGNINEKVKRGELVMKKVYGGLFYIDQNKLFFDQYNAKDLVEAYTTDTTTNKPIPAEKDVIYCGKEKHDVICGFELVK